MLGISLDSIGISGDKCKCHVSAVCSIDQCECQPFCKKYEALYLSIGEKLTKCVFLTFAPAPKTQAASELCPENDGDRFKSFYKMLKKDDNIESFILVAELTLKGQLHYHAFIRYKNKVTFIKRIVQTLYWGGNVLPFYGKPKKGIHYLFKTATTMEEYLEGSSIYIKSD